MTGRATLRASDTDREQVAECLRHAAAEGRLLTDELEDRLGAALSAKTYAELDVVRRKVVQVPRSHCRKGHKANHYERDTSTDDGDRGEHHRHH